MGLQLTVARGISALSTWGLKNVFRRPAANFPGKIALYVDPHLIADLSGKLGEGSIVVVGTNGKTTVTNLIADALEAAGMSVICNRTGANLDSGVATALLHGKRSDWGVFESDELWLAKVLPQLQANYLVLLNLFRDQLDRVGEIDRIQDSIVQTLGKSPNTVLVYNADDPLCEAIALQAAALPGREATEQISFGLVEDMGLPQNTVADAQMCQQCSSMLEYGYRQYGQLGAYRCPACGFERPALDYAADDIELGADCLSFRLRGPLLSGPGFASESARASASRQSESALGARSDSSSQQPSEAACARERIVHAPLSGAYMVYNLAAVVVAAGLAGCSDEALQRAIDAFDPQNGRLERLEAGGRPILLNLAKNPTGFNQNLRIIAQDEGPRAVAFFVNDKEGDGRDVSWIWDIDFEELADADDLVVFAGGIRKNDLQVRLKYAGIESELIDGPADMLDRTKGLSREYSYYLIANYTALPVVRGELMRMIEQDGGTEERKA